VKQDKFLLAILAGIVVLVVAAVIAVKVRAPGSEQYLNQNTPAAVVHDYYLAIQRKDYEKAHSYLSDKLTNKPNLEQFIQTVGSAGGNTESTLKIGEVRTSDQHTQVDVSITTYQVGSVFDSSRYTSPDTALLQANSAGEWKLLQFPYPYWGWDWNQEKQD